MTKNSKSFKKVPPELNDTSTLAEIAHRYHGIPDTISLAMIIANNEFNTLLNKLKLSVYRPSKYDEPCPICGSIKWHIVGTTNQKLQCEVCRAYRFPRAGSVSLLQSIATSSTSRTPGKIVVYCNYNVCVFNRKCKCTIEDNITINSERKCADYMPR